MSEPTTHFIEKYRHLTLAQLKQLNYQGQGQIQPGDQLWQAHLANQAHNIVEELEKEGAVKKQLPEIKLAKWKYDVLKRF